MREIKFRAWDTKAKKMVYTCQYLPPFKCNEKEDIWIMLQYTGLKDKNGKEIYEGDIVKTKVGVGSIVYMAKAAIDHEYSIEEIIPAFLIKWHDESSSCSFIYKSEKKELEVIGNIYENPELLKGEKLNNDA